MDTQHSDYARNKTYILHRIKTKSVKQKDGCIVWNGAKSRGGYGNLSVTFACEKKTRIAYAHRILWELTHNVKLERGQCVCHRCDNPSCVNIDHLFLGTHKDNTQDMMRKGRHKGYMPSLRRTIAEGRKVPVKHSRVRTFEDETIRQMANSTQPLKEVAMKYGVSVSYVSKLRNGKAKPLVLTTPTK